MTLDRVNIRIVNIVQHREKVFPIYHRQASRQGVVAVLVWGVLMLIVDAIVTEQIGRSIRIIWYSFYR